VGSFIKKTHKRQILPYGGTSKEEVRKIRFVQGGKQKIRTGGEEFVGEKRQKLTKRQIESIKDKRRRESNQKEELLWTLRGQGGLYKGRGRDPENFQPLEKMGVKSTRGYSYVATSEADRPWVEVRAGTRRD